MSVSQANLTATVEAAPGRIRRHFFVDRLYHWIMAACVLTLLATAFLPIIGVKFDWLGLHWMTGVVLAVLVVYHIVRASIWQSLRSMMIDTGDIANGWRRLARFFGAAAPAPDKPGKYNGLQKLYHAGIAALVLSIVASGLLMLLKIDTPFWRRNPYWFADYAWGVIYAVHDLAAMALLTMIMIHIYFAIRPDEWWLTRSMFRGWITRREYDAHHDRARWQGDDA
jgi:cytochrome b subunit of formate dehydrogenase